MKQAISEKLCQHFSNESQQKFMLLASVLDPRFKMLKFLSPADRSSVFTDLATVATEIASALESAEDEVPALPTKKPRLTGALQLMDYQAESSGSGGSSPSDVGGLVEHEVTQYKADAALNMTDDPLAWWKLNEHRYKVLAKLALKCCVYLQCPFQLRGFLALIVDKRRSSLHPDNVNCLLFLNRNM